MDMDDRQAKTGPSRRDVMVLAAGGAAAVAMTPAMTAPTGRGTGAPAAKPVAFVWMGQILLDHSGQEQPYIPPQRFSA